MAKQGSVRSTRKESCWRRSWPLRGRIRKIDVATYFSVGLDGTVYQVAFPHIRQRYVLAFGKDAVIKSEIKLDTNFGWIPSMVAPFASGDLLVSGLKYNPDGVDLPRLPFTGIFSSNGTLLKELTLF